MAGGCGDIIVIRDADREIAFADKLTGRCIAEAIT